MNSINPSKQFINNPDKDKKPGLGFGLFSEMKKKSKYATCGTIEISKNIENLSERPNELGG